jgi:acyl-coenzyme A synthetase/AMP-(fatty) acid ligase
VQALVVPDPACLEVESDLTRSLLEFARERLASHQVPRVIELVEDFPRTASGKILRGKLLKSMA